MEVSIMFYYFWVASITVLTIYKIYSKLSLNTITGKHKMTGKVIIITGSNTGIGYATAEDMARRGAKVILACRNETKALTARDNIISSTGNENVLYKHLDLASFQSIRKFAADIIKTEPKLDVLINNAGTGKLDNSLTADNLPIEAQINHFGPFLLTMMLVPLLKSSTPSRIINVSSILHRIGTIENLDKRATSKLQHSRVYSNTKLANVLFTRKLAQHLQGTGVTANCLHPGAVHTEIFRHRPKYFRFFLNTVLLNPWEGAQTSIFLAVEPELRNITGLYFSNCVSISPSKKAHDEEAAEKLWKMSNDIAFGVS